MRIGFTELILIIIIAIALIKPDKLKEYAGTLGRLLRYLKENKDKIDEDIIEPVKKAAEPIKEAVRPVQEIQEDLTSTVNDIKDEFKFKKQEDNLK